MPRAHWLILALGVAVMLFVSLSPEQRRPVTETLLPGTATTLDGDPLGEPDLLLESATITQFRPDGRRHYRLTADRIAYFPDAEQTLLDQPHLLLDRGTAPPWELTALQGRILGGSAAGGAAVLAPTRDAADTGAETVILQDQVRIRRDRSSDQFIELQTELLRLYPETEYAETDRPVIIQTEAGRTLAAGLTADLLAGRLGLASTGEQRVHTTLNPEQLQ